MQQATKTESLVERNLDICRQIMLAIEKDGRTNGWNYITPDETDTFGVVGIGDNTKEEIAYCINELIAAKLIKGKIEHWPVMPSVTSLTWAGHDFIANVTDDRIWKKTKEEFAKRLPAAGLDIIGEIAKHVVLKFLGYE